MFFWKNLVAGVACCAASIAWGQATPPIPPTLQEQVNSIVDKLKAGPNGPEKQTAISNLLNAIKAAKAGELEQLTKAIDQAIAALASVTPEIVNADQTKKITELDAALNRFISSATVDDLQNSAKELNARLKDFPAPSSDALDQELVALETTLLARAVRNSVLRFNRTGDAFIEAMAIAKSDSPSFLTQRGKVRDKIEEDENKSPTAALTRRLQHVATLLAETNPFYKGLSRADPGLQAQLSAAIKRLDAVQDAHPSAALSDAIERLQAVMATTRQPTAAVLLQAEPEIRAKLVPLSEIITAALGATKTTPTIEGAWSGDLDIILRLQRSKSLPYSVAAPSSTDKTPAVEQTPRNPGRNRYCESVWSVRSLCATGVCTFAASNTVPVLCGYDPIPFAEPPVSGTAVRYSCGDNVQHWAVILSAMPATIACEDR